MNEITALMRLHIMGVAVAATLVFGWLATGRYLFAVALLVALDWLLINLLNRITDVKEDEANGIAGTALVARHVRAFTVAWLGILVGSFALGHVLHPELTVWRVAVQVIGVGYSIPLVPTPRGWRRFKDLYFLKNFMSSVLFVLTLFVYTAAVNGWTLVLPGGWTAWLALMAFFVLFEITYEILYDLRDIEGDRLARVPTYPVVHGPETARRIIDGLLVASAAVVVAAVAAGLLGVREALFLAAPGIQWLYYRPRYARGLTSADCIRVTHLGTALLVVYLAGTWLWLRLGLPENIYLAA